MRSLVLVLFLVSGALGLVYEVVWTRMAGHVFGTTAVAVGLVLAAFMSGLALGAWWLGARVDGARRPLRVYALLELGVGLSALGAHLALARLGPLSASLHGLLGGSPVATAAARFGLAFVVVMAPTLLMGATLPALARFVLTRREQVGTGLSTLYALNVAGAVAGTLLAGFVLIGALGLDATVGLAVTGNLLVGLVAFVVSAKVGEAEAPADAASASDGSASNEAPGGEAVSPATRRLLLAGLGIAGLASFAYEVLWTRSLVVLLGNSTYAVTTMLTAFLSGLALGGWLVRFLLERVRDRVALFGWLQLLVGFSAAAALPALLEFVGPHAIRVTLGGAVGDPAHLGLQRFGVALAVMLPPATLIGAGFPLVGRVLVDDLRHTSRAVGRVTAVNTLGNVLGALLPALLLMQGLGIRRSLLALAALNVVVGLLLLGTRLRSAPRLAWSVPLVCLAAALLLARAPLTAPFPAENQTSWHRVLFYEEGPSAITTVLLDPEKGERSMCVDGVEIGGNTFTEAKQLLLAHVPKLFADDVGLELSIGLGSGMLVGESLRHPRVQRIDCVEIEPTVVAGARLFADLNHDALDDPRLNLVVDDVAHHLRTTDARYAVVSADEKTAQEYASNGFSYSRDYYELLRGRLAEGGFVMQWVPTTLPPAQYAMIVRTFTDAFPHALLLYLLPSLREGAVNTILVGSDAPLELDVGAMRRRWELAPEAWANLEPYGLTSPEALLAHVVADGPALRAAVADAPLNTFDRPRYEFYSAADYAVGRRQRLAINHAWLLELRERHGAALLASAASEPGDFELLQLAFSAEGELLKGFADFLAGRPDAVVFGRYERALQIAPWNDSVRACAALQLWDAGTRHAGARDVAGALQLMGRAFEASDHNALSRVVHSTLLSMTGDGRGALASARRAVELRPDLVAARRMLADALTQAGRTAEAAEQWRALLELEPGDRAARDALGG